jgi:YD repeat-containing protein
MKLTHTLKMPLIMLMGVLLASCTEDEWIGTSPSPALVKFQQETMGISELAGPTNIVLSFDKPATLSGIIMLKMETDFAEDFSTTPSQVNGKIEIPVAAGQSQVAFTLSPIHNPLYQGNKQVEFTIESVPEGMAIGTKKMLIVSIYEADQPNLVNFMAQEGTLMENTEDGFEVSIGLSLAAIGEGSVEVGFARGGSLYGTYFTTEPAAVDGKITLEVVSGTVNLPIKFIPINNATLNGHQEIRLSLTAATGVVSMGNQLSFQLSLLDDELMGMPKKFETIGYGTREMRLFEYNELGKISKVTWEKNEMGGTDTYHYDPSGKLLKISETPSVETRFQYDDQGRIILSERFQSGLLKKYIMYTYDDAGKVGEAAVFTHTPSGEFGMTELSVYLYYNKYGSLANKSTYVPALGQEEFVLLRSESYTYFLYTPTNPFPMTEVLPGTNVQKHYTASYTLSENGQDYSNSYTYLFNDLGMPVKRTGSKWEVTNFQYY